MREIFWEKYNDVLTKVEKFYLQKLLFEIDNYYPDDENQYAAAAKIGVTREYFGLIIHRLYKKILENPDLKKNVLKALRIGFTMSVEECGKYLDRSDALTSAESYFKKTQKNNTGILNKSQKIY